MLFRILIVLGICSFVEPWSAYSSTSSKGVVSAKASKKKAVKTKATKTKAAKIAKTKGLRKEVQKESVQEPLQTPKFLPMIATSAKQLLLIDYTTGRVLLEKNADQLMYPSSMTKVVTLYGILKKVRELKISLDTTFPVSEKAWGTGGSRMYVSLNSQVPLHDLLKGIVIQSGNDACIVATEGLSGSEDAFVTELNVIAREMGAKKTRFTNSHGLPDPNHLTTARDLALIARRLIQDFPEYYPLHAQKEFVYNKIKQWNRNVVLSRGIGCDGIKTGYTEGGGYGMIASAIQNGQRLILIANGMSSEKERAKEVTKILTWGFRSYANYSLLKKGQAVRQIPVALGAVDEVSIGVSKDVIITVPRASAQDTKISLEYLSPLVAPLEPGRVIGKAIITNPGLSSSVEVPVIVTQDVNSANFLKKIAGSLSCLFWGK